MGIQSKFFLIEKNYNSTAVFFSLLLFSNISYAYIDPGSGAYIVQAIITLVLSFIFYFKRVGKIIKTFIKENLKKLLK